MATAALIIFVIIMSSIMTFALLQSAKDADEAWERSHYYFLNFYKQYKNNL